MASAAAGNNAVIDALALGQVECARLLLKEGSPLDVERAAEVVIDKGQYEALKFLLSNYNLEVDKHFLLHRALVAHQEDIVKLLVESGAEVNCKGTMIILIIKHEQGCAHYSHLLPLQLSLFCTIDMTRFLLIFGADVNKQDYSGETTLIFACGSSVSAAHVVFLLENGAKVHIKSRNGNTALHRAVCAGDIEKLKILVEYEANVDAINIHIMTPLMSACADSYADVRYLKSFLKNRALPNVTDFFGFTALHKAVLSGDYEKAEILLQYGADINVNLNEGPKRTPLMMACADKAVTVECVKLLLENKALPNVTYISGDTALHMALRSGDIEKLRILVQYGADVNARDRKENTPLMLACADRSVTVECVRLLLENKALSNVTDIDGDTALHMALQSEKIEKLRIRFLYGADIHTRNRNKETPLMLACAEKCFNGECIKLLLENEALPNVTDTHGDTALHMALQSENIEKLKILVQHGADVNARNRNKETPLMLVCAEKCFNGECVKFLLENKALPNVTDTHGDTALHMALQSGDTEKLKILVQHGADVNARNRNKETPLMLVVKVEWLAKETFGNVTDISDQTYYSTFDRSGDIEKLEMLHAPHLRIQCAESYIAGECVEFLSEDKALPNVTDTHGDTALQVALQPGAFEKLGLLVRYGADVNARNKHEKTLLMLACSERSVNVQCVKLLLENKALPNVTDIDGDTALHMAVHSGDIEKLRILVQYGADVNVADGCKKTPLMLACSERSVNVQCVKFLLENKALPNVADTHGDTALHMALQSGDTEKLKILVQYGADVSVRNRYEKTPLILACGMVSVDVVCVKLLLENKALPNVTDIYGITALHMALHSQNIEKLKILVQYGAEINVRNENKQTPLMLARGAGRETRRFRQRFLCKSSETITFRSDLEARISRGETPFLTAVQTGKRQLIELLHDLGADVCAEDGEGQNAIMLAIKTADRNRKTCDLGLLQYWIDKGVSVNHRDKDGWTPLMLAAKYKNVRYIKCLVKAGADVNVVRTEEEERGGEKSTALSILLDDRWLDRSGCAEELIRHGAVNNLPEHCNRFLHRMIHIDYREMIQLLLTNGMPPTMSDLAKIRRFGSVDPVSPLTVALKLGNIPVIQYLLGNLMLCPSDNYGHSYFSQWRHKLISQNMTDVVTMMDEFYSQPKSLFHLSFVTISHALGGVPGRVDRVNSLPLPSKVKDKLLFKSIDAPLYLTKQKKRQLYLPLDVKEQLHQPYLF